MTKRTCRAWLVTLGFALMAAFSSTANASMSGIDHLPDNLSVTDFWVNGTGGFQAGKGGSSTPGPALPEKWHPGLTVHVVWDVRDWEHDKGTTHEADVPVDPYTEDGDLWVHFLANGTVRVVVSNMGPRSPTYPGPHDPIPQKEPWDMYPPRHDWRDWNEQRLDDRLIERRCTNESDQKACQDQAEEKLLDDERDDARRYLPRCAGITTGPAYEACKKQAWQSMHAARVARRCKVAPDLPECAPQKDAKKIPQRSTGVQDQ